MTLTVLGIKRSNAVPRGADLPDCRCAYNELLLRVSGSRGAGLGSLMTGDKWSVSRCLVMRKFGMDGGRARRGFAVVKPLGWKPSRVAAEARRSQRHRCIHVPFTGPVRSHWLEKISWTIHQRGSHLSQAARILGRRRSLHMDSTHAHTGTHDIQRHSGIFFDVDFNSRPVYASCSHRQEWRPDHQPRSHRVPPFNRSRA
jgi:hypothetical protein